MVTSAEIRDKAEPPYVNTLTARPHPTELEPPCTRSNAVPPPQASHLSFVSNNVHEKNLFTADRGDLQCLQHRSRDGNTVDRNGHRER